MSNKTDITTRADIKLVIEKFYDKLLVDELVGFLFTEVIQLNLKEHLPRLVDFWEDSSNGW